MPIDSTFQVDRTLGTTTMSMVMDGSVVPIGMTYYNATKLTTLVPIASPVTIPLNDYRNCIAIVVDWMRATVIAFTPPNGAHAPFTATLKRTATGVIATYKQGGGPVLDFDATWNASTGLVTLQPRLASQLAWPDIQKMLESQQALVAEAERWNF